MDIINIDELNAKRSKYIKFYLIPSIVVIAVAFLTFFLFTIISVLVTFIGVLAFSSSKKKIAKLDAEFKNFVLNSVLEHHFDEYSYYNDGRLSEKDYEMSYFKTGNRFQCNDSVVAKYRGIDLDFSDIHIENVTSSGKSTKRVTLFKGLFVRIANEIDLKGNLRVSTDGLSTFFSSYHKVKMESIDFNKRFNVVAEDEIDAFYILRPDVIEKILEFEKLFPDQVNFAVIGNITYVGIDDHSDRFTIPTYGKYSVEKIEKFNKQIEEVKAIIDVFIFN